MPKRRHGDSGDAGEEEENAPLPASPARHVKKHKPGDALESAVAGALLSAASQTHENAIETLNRTLVDLLTKQLKADAGADLSTAVRQYLKLLQEIHAKFAAPREAKKQHTSDPTTSAPPPLTFTFRPPQTTPPAFTFGVPQPSSTGFAFGGAASTSPGAPQSLPTSPFGAPSSAAASPFGHAASTASTFGFGASSSPPAATFGFSPVPMFGSAATSPSRSGDRRPASPATGFSFGYSSGSPSSPPTSFAQPKASFGAARPSSPATGFSFGLPQSSPSSGFSFVAPASSPPSPFGAATPASPVPAFGSSSAVASTKPPAQFGSPLNTPQTSQPFVSDVAGGFSFGSPAKPKEPQFSGFMAAPNTTFGVWNEPSLLSQRISNSDIKPLKQITTGGFGDVWLSEFQGKQVAVKRLTSADQTKATSVVFAAEMKLMTELKHPQITAFIGVEWTKEWEAQALSAFAELGDLRSLLDSPEAEAIGWADFKCQAAIDVADALTYLHTRSPKVVMEVLRGRNVLVCDRDGNCKLSVFAAARSRSVAENLTSRMATTPWLAPEIILDTASKSERSVVYSFGALLCELDTTRPPLEDARNPDGSPMSSFKVAQLVSLGQLKPTPSQECPQSIAALVTQCVAFDPLQRPTVASVAYRLREILKGEL